MPWRSSRAARKPGSSAGPSLFRGRSPGPSPGSRWRAPEGKALRLSCKDGTWRPLPIPHPRHVSLFCFPFAGGNAYAYRQLEACRPPGLSVSTVELPGRGRRAGEALRVSLEELAGDAFSQVEGRLCQGPYALFGHSMGALLAHLCLQRILDAGLPLPEALFLSGRGAPSQAEITHRHRLPRSEFIEMLQDLGGCPRETFESPELLDYLEPILRADFQAVETWRPDLRAPCPVPVTFLRGIQDAVTREQAAAWSRETTAAFRLHEFEGDHFFIQAHWPRIASLIALELGLEPAPATPRAPRFDRETPSF